MEGRFFGRDIISKPACPFCGALIDPPGDLDDGSSHEMPMGRCSCGAVYVCDVIGHNLGTAMSEALVSSCYGDWDQAWDLLPEDDYQEALVEDYDLETNLIIHGGVYEGRRIAGVLFFIRLNNAVRKAEGKDLKKPEIAPLIKKKILSNKSKKAFSKKEIETMVEQYQVETILVLAEQDKRIIRDLQRLLYSVDKQKRWRTADILGRVSVVIAKNDPEAVSKLMQGLFTSLSDTAASSWGSLDAAGEIISNLPERFGRYIPQLYGFLRDRALLPEVLRALVNIASAAPELIRKNASNFFPLLEDYDYETRGYAAILIGNMGTSEAVDNLKKLTDDSEEMEVYQDGNIRKTTVGKLAEEALARICV